MRCEDPFHYFTQLLGARLNRACAHIMYSYDSISRPIPFVFPSTECFTFAAAWIHVLLMIWAGICGAANSSAASRRGGHGYGNDAGFDRFGDDDDDFGGAMAFGGAMTDEAFDGGFDDDERGAYRAMGMGMGMGGMMGSVGDFLQNKKREPPKSYVHNAITLILQLTAIILL
jgi:hypothetical protein